MGRALLSSSTAARHTFEEADEALGFSLSSIILEGPVDELKKTAITQPAIVTVSVAAFRALRERGAFDSTLPAFAAGHSLGEYAALVASSALEFGAAVKAVRARGTFMQEAVPEGQGAMAAVLGLPAVAIEEVLATTSTADAYVACANFNGPDQTVIAGSVAGVQLASTALKAKGAKRVMPLPVSAPFHCRLMAPVVPRLRDVLGSMTFAAPAFPVVTNVEAAPCTDAERLRALLLEQVTAPVRFTEIAAFLLGASVKTFVEIGPGKTLLGIVKRMPGFPEGVTLCNVEDEKSLDATLEHFATLR